MIEYHALQKKTEEEKVYLIQEDPWYFPIFENPSALLKVVYAENTFNKRYVEPELEACMEHLGIYKSNSISFIKD